MEELEQFFVNNFGEMVWLAVMIFAMLPIAEVRLAIPFGLSVALWGNLSLHPAIIILCAFVGALIPGIFLLLLLKPIFKMLKKTKAFKSFVLKLEKLFKNKAKNLEKKDKRTSGIIALILFNGLPLPLTGVWTGSAVAAFSNFGFWTGFMCITIGNLIDTIIISLICLVFGNSVAVVLIAMVILIALYLFWILYLYIKNKRKQKKMVKNALSQEILEQDKENLTAMEKTSEVLSESEIKMQPDTLIVQHKVMDEDVINKNSDNLDI